MYYRYAAETFLEREALIQKEAFNHIVVLEDTRWNNRGSRSVEAVEKTTK